ncbi:ABC transporter permease [Bacillus sp. RG28]|uniref:ABC transporter permease n=1 Tax=Gottfriedia endophytica TaxID=2820819 RepID=A0A940SI39_9BACI|nr:ABC transporter permease [Gottfriedia endophytica]MBP0724111.1 ABC transporter permease [Gottfriedia endophytica]
MKRLIAKGWRPLLVLVLFFVIWECTSRYSQIPKWLLPAPSTIFKEAFTNYNLFLSDTFSTTKLAVSGYIIGSLIGIIIAVLLHVIPGMKNIFYPYLILSQNIPIIVLAPLLVVWFGFGILPKIIIITLVCFFPITVAALDGFKNVPNDLMQYMRMSGATKWQIFTKVEFPNALPPIFSGLKISATYSVMGAVISEWLGSDKGIGVFMTLSSSSFRTDRVFIAIFIIILLSLIFYIVIVIIEKSIIKWMPKEGKR